MEVTDSITKRKWSIDLSNSRFKFKIEHLIIDNVKGTFTETYKSNYAAKVLKLLKN